MKRFFVILSLLLTLFLFSPNLAFSNIGVGVGTGKIQVDEKLKPGLIYELPSINVINTGDQSSNYKISVAYHTDQPELKPNKNWFIFSPKTFYLKPGEVRVVDIKINLPLRIEPGKYFAYLEAQPSATAKKGKTSIGVAAASKLYFTVVPGSFFEGVYYKLISFWKVYAPWPQRTVIAVLIVSLLILFKKFFNIKINLKKPDSKPPKKIKKDE
ncbi:MAG: hypothetical protein ABH812_01055 [bacterium]